MLFSESQVAVEITFMNEPTYKKYHTDIAIIFTNKFYYSEKQKHTLPRPICVTVISLRLYIDLSPPSGVSGFSPQPSSLTKLTTICPL